MPEGDTIYRAAVRVRAAIDGQVITSIDGSNPSLRAASGRLIGSRVTGVQSYGKQLIISTDSGLGIRTHLGMPGVWRTYRSGQRWNHDPGAARVVIRVDGAEAVCFAAPDVEVSRVEQLEAGLAEWGPDLADPNFDLAEALRRAADLPDGLVAADLVLDQRVAAGAGNVFKSEVLFLERIHPSQPVGTLNDSERRNILGRAHQLVRLNLNRNRRITTGDLRRGHEMWVYGRAGKPCRRCGTQIRLTQLGRHERDSYWCPACQPLTSEENATDQT